LIEGEEAEEEEEEISIPKAIFYTGNTAT